MMDLEFHKYEGTGNDFILADNRNGSTVLSAMQISSLCDRHFGIGADGILLLNSHLQYDFAMEYYNSDGSPATFCGNGGRCLVAFARRLGIISRSCTFQAADGIHKAEILEYEGNTAMVELGMQDGLIYRYEKDFYYLNTGTYHTVKFVPDPETVDIEKEGSKIRYSAEYQPHGTNVNFASYHSGRLVVRTYEKGVEAETLSCGTGATAAAIAASLRHGGNRFELHVNGGQLNVRFERSNETFTQVKLTGPARRVFSGTIKI